MAGFNYAQNIIGLDKVKGDIHELEVDVANLSASTLPYNSEKTTKEEIDTKITNSGTVSTPSPLEVNGTFQIPADLLSYKILLITLRRAGFATSIFVLSEKLAVGFYNYGITGYCTSTEYYTITINETGLITLTAKSSGLGDANIDIIGIGKR